MGIFDRIASQLGDLIDQIDVGGADGLRLHVERGEALLRAGDADGAVREFEQALSQKPDFARAALLLGEAELARKGFAAAERALRVALLSRPDFPEAEVRLGEALAGLHDGAGAEDAFRRALDGGADDPALRGAAFRGLGALHLWAGRADKAVRELRKATAALPGDAEANRLLGEALLARGDLEGARVCLAAAAEALAAPVESQAGERSPAPAGSTDESGAPPAEPGVVDAVILDEPAAEAEALPPPESAPLTAHGEERLAARAAILSRLAEVATRLGRDPEARAAWQAVQAANPRSVEAHLGLATLAARAGDRATAQAEAASAVALERSPRTLLAAARVTDGGPLAVQAAFEEARAAATRREQRAAVALEALRAALRAADPAHPDEERALLGAAARAAHFVQMDAPWAAGAAEGALHASDVADVEAAVALAALVGAGGAPPDLERARLHLGRALAAASEGAVSVEARLVEARVALAVDDVPSALLSLRRAVSASTAGDDRARRRLVEALRGPAPPTGDLYALLRAAHARLQQAPRTSDLAPEAARVVEILDRPLLVTVMGEFNAGKSTFVNALVGEEVAPMGIVPTTATINVLKYGAERGGRIVYRDDTVRAIPWSEVGGVLRALDADEAGRIRFVEVLYPLETLQRVNIVDTPGLNSIRPEHEATAREFLTTADAVIWLFSCRQAGTASEREALDRIRAAHKKALGVVNQIDRIEDPAEVEQILAHLAGSFGDVVEALVPFSAREALLGRGDPERLARSNRPLLDEALEARFFRRAKSIQRTQAVRRLGDLLDEAARRAAEDDTPDRRQAFARAHTEVATARARFSRFLDEERLRLIAGLDALFGQAAREVLEFVRPRSWAFGANQASRADQEFLVELARERLGALGEASRARVAVEAQAAARTALAALPEEARRGAAVDESARLDAEVYARYAAFVRGYLRGGRLDDFFVRVLPKIELTEAALRRALLRDLPALDVLEEELVAPLRGFHAHLFDRLAAHVEQAAAADDAARLEAEAQLAQPVAALRAALAGFAPTDEAEDRVRAD